MGWTAAASMVEKDAWGPGKDDITSIPRDHPAIMDFAQAKKQLYSEGHASDCTFDIGLLCVRATGAALFDAVGQPMQHSGIKSAQDVKAMASAAVWDKSSDKYNDSERATARAFLEVCVKHELHIDLG